MPWLSAVNLLALALTSAVAGIHLFGQISLNPALRRLDAQSYIRAKQALDRDAPRLARPLMLASLAAALGMVVLAIAVGRPGVLVASSIALLALVVTLAAIVFGDLPINRAMAGWNAQDPPENWRAVRGRWERFFLIRTVASAIAVAALVAAAL